VKISRQVGSVNQILQIYVQNATVSTGAGLANVLATNVSYSWFRSNQNGVSTGTGGSTGTLGIYSSGAWLQINSATALGWYQFGVPNDALLLGDSVGIHFYVSSGPLTTMAPLPVEIELTKTNNQQYTSSTVYSSTQIVASVTSTLTVSTQTIDKGGYGVTSIASAVTTTANVVQIYGSAAVTSASGQFQVSTQAIDKGGYGVTSIAATVTTKANVIQIQGDNAVTSVAGMLDINVARIVSSAAVTSAAGILNVSTQAIDRGGYGVTTIAANITSNVNVVQWLSVAAKGGNGHVGVDWANVTNKAAYNDLSSTFISTNQAIAGASAPTALQVAQAVWDEIATSHAASSTFGFITQTMAANVSTISSQTVLTSSLARSSDARLIFLDGSVSSRATSSDARLAFLDVSVSSRVSSTDSRLDQISTRAVAGDAMALTAGERAALAGVILSTTQPESFRSVNATGSVIQLMYEVLANVTDMSNSGTTRTLNSVTSHAAATVQYQYDSTTPSAITRIA